MYSHPSSPVRRSQGKAQDLKLLGNVANGILLFSGNDIAVVNCFIVGINGVPSNFGIVVRSGSGDLVKDNQISETAGFSVNRPTLRYLRFLL
jgi:hypothetical protein